MEKIQFFKKLIKYQKVEKFAVQRYFEDKPVGGEKTVVRPYFANFILHSDDLPDLRTENAVIDIISPVLKSGKFYWKGFYQGQIISFEMADNAFQIMVQQGKVKFSSNVSISTRLVQNRKIDENGHIKVAKTTVTMVLDYSIDGIKYLTSKGKNYRDDTQP